MLAVDVAETKLSAAAAGDPALVELVDAVKNACKEDASAAGVLQDPACATSRVVFLWSRYALCEESSTRDVVERAMDDAISLAGQDALMAHCLLLDSVSLMRDMRQRPNGQHNCFEATERAVHEEASVLERSMEENASERELYSRLRRPVAARIDANDETGMVWWRCGLTRIVAQLSRSPSALQFVETLLWRDGWRELWFQLNSATRIVVAADTSDGVATTKIISAACHLAWASARAIIVASIESMPTQAALRSLERAVCTGLNAMLRFSQVDSSQQKNASCKALSALARASAVTCLADEGASRVELYVDIALSAREARCAATSLVSVDDYDRFHLGDDDCLCGTPTVQAIRREIRDEMRRDEFDSGGDGKKCTKDSRGGGIVLAERVALTAVYESISLLLAAKRSLPERLAVVAIDLLTSPSLQVRRELAACFDALMRAKPQHQNSSLGSMSLQLETQSRTNMVCAYVVIALSARRIERGEVLPAYETASLDSLANDVCSRVEKEPLELLVDVALQATMACSPAVGERCLLVARDLLLKKIVLNDDTRSERELVKIISRIARHRGEIDSKTESVDALARAWRAHPKCTKLGSAIRKSLPYISIFCSRQIGARLGIVESLMQPGDRNFAAAAIRFAFVQEENPLQIQQLNDANPADYWWKTHAALITSLVDFQPRANDQPSSVAAVALATLEACATLSVPSLSHVHQELSEIMCAHQALAKLLNCSMDETSAGVNLRVRHAISEGYRHIVGESGTVCRAAYALMTENAMDCTQGNDGDEGYLSYRVIIDALETRCADALRKKEGAQVSAAFSTMASIIESDRHPKTKFGSWALESLVRVWRASSFSGLAYSELRRFSIRQRIAESVADAEHCWLISDADVRDQNDSRLGEDSRALSMASTEPDGTVRVVTGDRSPLDELKSLIEVLALPSSGASRGGGFTLVETLGSLVFWPRRRRKRLTVETSTIAETPIISRQTSSSSRSRLSDRQSGPRPSLGYGLTIAASAAPRLLVGDVKRCRPLLAAISPFPGADADKALVRLRPAACLCEITLSAATLKTPGEFERMASVAADLFDCDFRNLLKSHVDKLTALLTAELAGPRVQAARGALRLVASSCVDESPTPRLLEHENGNGTNDAVKKLFADKFLMIVARVLHWDKGTSASNKAARLRCMAYAVDYLEPQVAARFAPKVMATLSAALFETSIKLESQDIELIGGAVDALSRYARLLPVHALKAQLSSIVTALNPAFDSIRKIPTKSAATSVGPIEKKLKSTCKAIEQRAIDLLRWLLVERRDDLGFEAIATIPCFPDFDADTSSQGNKTSLLEARDSFSGALRQAVASASSQTTPSAVVASTTEEEESLEFVKSELSRLSRLAEHESTHVQLSALDVLRRTLMFHHSLIASLLLDPSRRCATPVVDVLAALLRTAFKSAKVTDDSLKLACAACIGELGALDPTRLQSTALLTDGSTSNSGLKARVANPFPKDSVEKDIGHSNVGVTYAMQIPPPPWEQDRDHLAARIIRDYLVPALREGMDNQGQDSAAYAIQELLKLLRHEDDAIPAWAKRFFQAGGCYELVAPYAATEYVLCDAPKHRKRKSFGHPDAVKHASQSSKWLSTWTRLLVSRARSTTHAPIFRACRAIVRFNDGLATALLPYLVADALCCGDEVDTLSIVAELKAIIDLASSKHKPTDNTFVPPSGRRVSNRNVDPVALQITFTLHATLDQWCDGANWIEQRFSENLEPDLTSSPSRSALKCSSKKRSKASAASTLSLSSSTDARRQASPQLAKKNLRFRPPFACFDAVLSDTEANDDDESEAALLAGNGDMLAREGKVDISRKRLRSLSRSELFGQSRMVSERIEAAVAALSYTDLAKAAEAMGAYGRALMYYERGLKQTSLKTRSNASSGVIFGDHADGYLPALQSEHIEMLQRLAWRLDRDPDYLAGLAAARGVSGSRATLVQRVREHESEGQWRDALHCYEHILRVHATTSTVDVRSSNGDDDDVLVTRTMSIEDAARGLLQCQLELGHLESAIINADGFLSETASVKEGTTIHEIDSTREDRRSMLAAVAPVAAEAAWRLQRWPRMDALFREYDDQDSKLRSCSSSAAQDPRLGLARCIFALHNCARISPSDGRESASLAASAFIKEIVSARLEAMAGLSAASMESYSQAYPFIARLGALRELEHAKTLVDIPSLEARLRYYHDHLAPRWEARLRGAATGTSVEMLAIRRACLELAGLRHDAADCSELSARLARKAGSVTLAQSDLRDAARLGASGDTLLIAEAKLGLVDNSAASALRAYSMLEPVELDVRATRAKFGLLEHHDGGRAVDTSRALVASREGGPLQRMKRAAARRVFAKRLVLATDCLVDAQMRHGADVVQRYKLAIDLRPKWDRAYFGCARVFDSMLASRRRELVDATQGGVTGEIGMGAVYADGACNFDTVVHEHAKAAITHYALCLEHSAKYAETALPRLLTLWFEFAAIDAAAMVDFGKTPAPMGASQEEATRHKERIASGVKSLKRFQAAITETIKHMRKNVQAAVIYGAIQQILSRAG